MILLNIFILLSFPSTLNSSHSVTNTFYKLINGSCYFLRKPNILQLIPDDKQTLLHLEFNESTVINIGLTDLTNFVVGII
jgi:hypothetical protein